MFCHPLLSPGSRFSYFLSSPEKYLVIVVFLSPQGNKKYTVLLLINYGISIKGDH